jgi:flagellar hook protein FlgE
MSNYTIALSGLQNTSLAIDTTSNNIANANTIGYKAGEYVFADQFVKAINPADTARVGMGTQSLGVRRAMLQGTITNSANPLDLAISGKGMFRLLQGSGSGAVDPSAVYYSRNGQFSVDKQGYIVNENGMYLTGYQPARDGNSVTDDYMDGGVDKNGNKKRGRLLMPNSNLPGNETTTSSIAAMLNSTSTAFTSTANVSFDPTQSTFNNKTTQTVFDNEGNSHTLEVYYRRVSDSNLTITASANGYSYSPSRASSPSTLGATLVTINPNSVLRMDSASNASAQSSVASTSTTITLTSAAASAGSPVDVTGMRVFVNGVDSGATVSVGGASTSLTTTSAVTVPSGAAVTFYAPRHSTTVNGATTTSATLVTAAAAPAASVGDRIFVAGLDTGKTVNAIAGNTVTASGTLSIADAAKITFFKPNLDMTLIAPDGTAITLQGFGNKKQPGQNFTANAVLTNATTITTTSAATGVNVGDRIFVKGVDTGRTVTAVTGSTVTASTGGITTTALTDLITFSPTEPLTTTMAKVEVYASIDGRFFDYNDTTTTSSRALTPQTPGVLGYKEVSELCFIGGKNIDSLVTDTLSGNPMFNTVSKLSTRVTNQAGGSSDLVFNLDLSDTSLQAGAFQITRSTQNGEPLARLTNVTVDNEGRIVGVYGSGKLQYVGQLALVHFDAAEGLIPVGKNAFAASVESGTEHSVQGVLVGRAGTGVFGEVKGQALESSTVDLANELVRLMVLQRSYSANSQSMKAFDQTLRDTLQMVG